MNRQIVTLSLAMICCLIVSQADAEQRGGRSGGGRPPGGNWSEGNRGGQQGPQMHSGRENESGGNRSEGGHNESESKNSQNSAAKGAAAGHEHNENKNPQASGAQGAAAGAAASNKNQPKASGAEGAAAGAAASNKNQPKASGAEGAAAGAAAENRNQPKATGAQGAAAGAAVANKNQPNYSGAEGAAAANRNQPNYSGAEGAAAGAAVASRNQPQYSGAAGAVAGTAAVRNSFDRPDLYGQQWRGNNPTAWAATGWAANAEYTPTNWNAVATQNGYANTPVAYNYGSNVTCQSGNVQINNQPAGTAEEFSQQAAVLANTGYNAKPPATDTWLPIGVFAMVRNEQQHPQLFLQMAVNKQGTIRGNYTDETTDHTRPIHGAVDKTTQRMAWIVGDNIDAVMEAGLSNLTKGEATALLHKNGQTERWLLVRMNLPDHAASSSPGSSNP